ncbi:Pimeloyl-ACP methyl ester carboxylesterase [Daejeonella rubra]|uniref:Pimeloyl-ACP methyl ester carboxylesterase n=1 Tax=Daejeonella rubra TaxID=990371 RepID=A0A1G9RJT7_9SPHI|nr:alpha/beta hydrolase [Daejeonella rubra]SDM23589.1 Pimeloyl-ACP methyl ester carboxylesterase [Daejeonella rubra]
MKRICFFLLFAISTGAFAQSKEALSITLENVEYPYPINFLSLSIEGQDVRMAYMDIKPANFNGKTLMLFHGKNFGGYYWTNIIRVFSEKGYRVLVPDQIGFGKSSKPFINYSFHRLAAMNRQLMDTLKIQHAVVMGHSMGGMLASRFALLYPERTAQLILENPIGLEDYRTFVPFASIEAMYQTELKTTPESVKKYYQSSYFVKWKPEYDDLVRIASGVSGSSEFPRYAKVAALTSQMVYEQPVIYELPLLKVPVLLLIGTQDKTIVGKARLSPDDQKKFGRYDQLGKQTAARIPGSRLVEFENSGHIPHLEIPEEFLKALVENIK